MQSSVKCPTSDSEEYPGIDYKCIARPVSNKIRISHGTRFISHVAKRLADPEVIEKLQLLNPNGSTLVSVDPWPPGVSIDFVDPWWKLGFPQRFQDSTCEGLTSEIKYLRNEEPQEGFMAFPKTIMKRHIWTNKSNPSPHIAVQNLNGRKQVVISSRSRQVFAPSSISVPVNFNSKHKYAQTLSQLCDQMCSCPNDIIQLLDANDPGGSHTILESSSFIQRTSNEDSDLLCIYDDQFQHKMLLVPLRSKRGYETETLDYLHTFPVSARFRLGKEIFNRKFDLNLKMTFSPQQQYCIAFLFPNTTSGIVTVFKLALSIYSIFPISAREAHLTAFFPHPVTNSKVVVLGNDACVQREFNPEILASDFVSFIRADLTKNSFTKLDKLLTVNYEAGWRHNKKTADKYRWNRRRLRLDRLDYLYDKHRKKQDIFETLKSDFNDWVSTDV